MFCSYCHKKNHTGKICFKCIREEKFKGDKPTCYNMFNVAAISVMSVDNFIKLNISDYPTRETYDIVRSLTGTQKVDSIVTGTVTVHSKAYRLDYGYWMHRAQISMAATGFKRPLCP